MNLANLRIQTKLLLGFGLVLSLLIGVAAFAITQLHRVTEQTTVIKDRWLPSVYSIEEMRLGAGSYRRQQYAHLTASDAATMEKYEGEMVKALAVFSAGQKIYEPLPQTEEENTIYKQFVIDWKAYQEFGKQFLEIGKKDEAHALLMGGAMRDTYYRADKALNRIIEINNDGAAKAGLVADQVASRALWLLSAATLAAVVIGLVTAWLIARGISRPIRSMASAMQEVAEGDLTVRIPSVGKDEIGEMAAALNTTVETLHGVMAEIRAAADQTAASGEELSASAQNISSGAQTQASSVEEISASVQELSKSIELVAAKAGEANRVAQGTSATAEAGSTTVKRSIDGMKAINDSSSQIAKIIGVINQIANQTNLLALNAAIEAASAGEHGLGFAVVADEVRKLAERSSTAAQEIAQLIDESGKRVTDGATLSHEVGKSLHAIIEGITSTSQGMASINASTEQQAVTAKELSKGAEGISAITEENSASAEEMAASAEELSAQAQRLQELVARFHLAEDSERERRPALAAARRPAAKPEPRAGLTRQGNGVVSATRNGQRNGAAGHAPARATLSRQSLAQEEDGELETAGKALYHE